MTPRVTFGLFIVVFGVAMLLDNLHLIEARNIIRFWPAAMVVVGLSYLFRKESSSERLFGGLLTLVGLVLLSGPMFGINVDIWRFWPLAIVFIGIMIVSRAFQKPEESVAKVQVVFGGSGQGTTGSATSDAPRAGSQDTTYSEVAIWSGIEKRVASPAFKRADLTAVMGGIEFDLRQAGADQGHAVIEVFAVWGGIEIIVPPDWAVSNKVTAIMGGVEDQSSGTQMARSRLTVQGVVLMGGVTIKT
jgi:predicted membrane protein